MYDEVCIAAAAGLLPMTDTKATMKEVKKRIRDKMLDGVTVREIGASADEAQAARQRLAEQGVKSGKFRKGSPEEQEHLDAVKMLQDICRACGVQPSEPEGGDDDEFRF